MGSEFLSSLACLYFSSLFLRLDFIDYFSLVTQPFTLDTSKALKYVVATKYMKLKKNKTTNLWFSELHSKTDDYNNKEK